MLNFEKRNQFTKEYSYEPRMVEKWVLWYIWSKKNRYESEKTTIASTTSDFFDGYVKTTVLRQYTSKIVPKIVKTHSFFEYWCNIYFLVKASSVRDFNFKPMKSATSS